MSYIAALLAALVFSLLVYQLYKKHKIIKKQLEQSSQEKRETYLKLLRLTNKAAAD